MSGIAGILGLRGRRPDPGLIGRLTQAMASQGPDGRGDWAEGPMAMGHVALYATPEAHLDTQPFSGNDGRYVVSFDGRLDNRETLHRTLVLRRPLADLSDAALVLAAWDIWGQDCPAHLLGDFAFAIWDRTSQALFLARDHMGARPLYWAHQQGLWSFASFDEALLCMPGVEGVPDETKLADAIAPGPDVDPRASWLRDVRQVMPGESLQVTADGQVMHRDYWHPVPTPAFEARNEAEYIEAFESVFAEAVRARLRSSTPPAAMVSGGMDTAGLMAMVRRELDRGGISAFHAYSAVSDDPQTCIETRCIHELTRHPGIVTHTLSVPSMQGMVNLQDLLREAWMQPHVTTSSILLPAMMALAAQRQGHKMMLTGVSGDVTLSTPLRYPARYWRQGRPWLAWQACRDAARHNTYLRGTSPLAHWLYCGVLAFLPVSWRLLMRQQMDVLTRKPSMAGALSEAMAQRVNWHARYRETMYRHGRDGGGESAAVKADQVFRWPGLTYGLTGYARVAARYGIEFRDPWADRRVVEFFLRIPLKWQVHQGWTKYLVRRALSGEFPDWLLWRTGKEHLGWHFAHEVMRHQPPLTSALRAEQARLLAPYLGEGNVSRSDELCRDGFLMQTLAGYLRRISTTPRA